MSHLFVVNSETQLATTCTAASVSSERFFRRYFSVAIFPGWREDDGATDDPAYETLIIDDCLALRKQSIDL